MERFVRREIERADPAVCEEFARLGVATVYEAQGQTGYMDTRMRPIQQGKSVCGPAVTVICPAGDNLMIHAAVECCQPGDILVVTTEGESNRHGYLGDLLARSLMGRGVRGLIMDGGVRDTARLREMGFPVWSTAVACAGTTKIKAGWVNAPAVCAGSLVEGGDLIVADDDGVVVVKRTDIASSLEKSKARERKEEETVKKIEAGQLGVDFYGFREVLAKLGVKYL
ncbi:MAG TPA: 4-carboxy-4-hydroxy-2-oxoadipate aldolase/oxaloacetate decarboxylase [Rectinemataceae bacterium]|nr:4-carboxy-4-hydroxy-2-oxoadipate aldolase/oxaloacetate decarboxylase [Rectinemataceae bacterium]